MSARVIVVCPSCAGERELSDSVAWRIRKGQVSGMCASCSWASRRRTHRVEAEARFADRFWSKVEKTAGCWLWTAGTKQGYGQFGAGQVNHYYWPRIIWFFC